MANAITLSRLVFLIIAVWLLYQAGPTPKVVAFVLIIFLIALDGVDGYVARKLGETSELGSVMDIAIDRVVENVLWIVYADIQIVPVAIALIVVSRGLITDAIRSYALAKGETAFEMMHTPWARWVVSGRPMRAFYGFIKAFVFAALALWLAINDAVPQAAWKQPVWYLLQGLVYITVALTIIRGAPVVYESRRFFFGEPVGN